MNKSKHNLLKRVVIFVLFLGLIEPVLPIFVNAAVPLGDYQAREWMEIDVLHELGYDGDDVTIAIIDSGCENHVYFTDNLTTTLVKYMQVNSNTSFTNTTDWDNDIVNDPKVPTDHGTPVTGVSLQFAPKADLVFYETYYPTTRYMTELRCAALKDLAQNANSYGVDILSLSWGFHGSELDSLATSNISYVVDDIEQALQDIVNAGVTVFIASGNHGDDIISWPANLSLTNNGIVSVGGVYDGTAADPGKPVESSNYGPALDLMAVGDNVYTTTGNSNSWRNFGGTSASAPMAAGIAACLIEQYNSVPTNQRPATITPSFIKNQLCDNAEMIYTIGDADEKQGNGVIRPVDSMINWYDYVDSKTANYGTITDFNKLTDGSGSAVFQESGYNQETELEDEDFSSWPPTYWSIESGANWHKISSGGQSGAYAKCQVDEGPPETGSGYFRSAEYDTRNVEEIKIEFYVKTGFYPGNLVLKVFDSSSNWDTIGTYSYKYAWTKITWTSTSLQYQHRYFRVEFDALVEENEWVGIDTFSINTINETYKFSHDFHFTERTTNLYSNATLNINITSHTGLENLEVSCYNGSDWIILNSTAGIGFHSYEVGIYAISSLFKVRIKSVSNIDDYSQDSWTISFMSLLVFDQCIGIYDN